MTTYYCDLFTGYKRRSTKEVKVGGLFIGNGHPIRIQTMTTTDTMDTESTVSQSIRCIEAGAELIWIMAPNKREAQNLLNIKKEIRKRGYNIPLAANIHFAPDVAEIAARIVEEVQVNLRNYADKKKFELKESTEIAYRAEL